MRTAVVCTATLLFVSVIASPARAQNTSWRDVAVSAVAVDYDLSGVGTTTGLAVRTTRDFTPNVALELRGLFAKPDQQFGASTLLVFPEAQIQYRWNLGRFSPFVGAGGGLVATRTSVGTLWDPTLSVAGGTGFRLTDRLGLVSELRVRGVEWRFTGSTAEFSAGLAWHFPRM